MIRSASGGLRIAHVVDSLEVGGAERLTVALASHQRLAGHDVTIHCLFAGGPLHEAAVAADIRVLYAPQRGRSARFVHLARAFRARKPDVVHCHNIAATVTAGPVARAFGVKCVMATRHGFGNSRGAREARFWIAARSCHRVIAVCEAARARLAAHPLAAPARLVAILNGAERLRQPPPAAVPECPRMVAACVARLAWPKNQAVLIDALAKTRALVPELELWLIGDGPDRSRLERHAAVLGQSDAVRFLGERHDVGALLGRADLFVLASETEGVPLALLEGLAAGLPPIVSDAGGMPEVVRRAGVGAVVPVNDSAALAEALVRFAEQRAQWPAWSSRARAAFEREFTVHRMCIAYDRLIQERLPAPEALCT